MSDKPIIPPFCCVSVDVARSYLEAAGGDINTAATLILEGASGSPRHSSQEISTDIGTPTVPPVQKPAPRPTQQK